MSNKDDNEMKLAVTYENNGMLALVAPEEWWEGGEVMASHCHYYFEDGTSEFAGYAIKFPNNGEPEYVYFGAVSHFPVVIRWENGGNMEFKQWDHRHMVNVGRKSDGYFGGISDGVREHDNSHFFLHEMPKAEPSDRLRSWRYM